MKTLLTILITTSMLLSCTKMDDVKTNKPKTSDINELYSTKAQLNEFKDDPTIVDYTLARQMAFVDMTLNNSFAEYGWNDCRIADQPIIIYGLDNRPQYYDFPILDANDSERGIISVYARKTSVMQIAFVSKDITQHNGTATKLGTDNAIFVDRSGTRYMANRQQTRNATFSGKSVKTGETVNGLTYMTDEQVIEDMRLNILPQVCSNEAEVDKTAENMQDRVEEAKRVANLFWGMAAENKEAILSFRGINDATEGLNKMFKNIPEEQVIRPEEERASMAGIGVAIEKPGTRVSRRTLTISQNSDGELTWLNEIHAKSRTYGTGGYCGQWVCAFLVGAYGYTNISSDQISTEIGTGPMIVSGIDRVLRRYSSNYLGLSGTERSGWDIYWYVIQDKVPGYKLTYPGGTPHWTLLYGSYRVKRWLTTNYYFMQIDNGTMVGSNRYTRNPADATNYSGLGAVDLLYRVLD